jgi:hypothetical protein
VLPYDVRTVTQLPNLVGQRIVLSGGQCAHLFQQVGIDLALPRCILRVEVFVPSTACDCGATAKFIPSSKVAPTMGDGEHFACYRRHLHLLVFTEQCVNRTSSYWHPRWRTILFRQKSREAA